MSKTDEDWAEIEEADYSTPALSFDSIAEALASNLPDERDNQVLLATNTSSTVPFNDDRTDGEEIQSAGGSGDDTSHLSNTSETEFAFAVGPKPRDGSTCGPVHDVCCPTCPRVGNMIIIHETKDRNGRRQLNCVFGPCWPFMCFVTLSLIIGLSTMVTVSTWNYTSTNIKVLFISTEMLTLIALLCTSFRDPGILPRHQRRPIGVARHSWRYSDQGQTYRPRGALYSEDAECILEGFDHVCPWTGTAIAKKNMPCFQAFVCLIFLLIALVGVVFYYAGIAYFGGPIQREVEDYHAQYRDRAHHHALNYTNM